MIELLRGRDGTGPRDVDVAGLRPVADHNVRLQEIANAGHVGPHAADDLVAAGIIGNAPLQSGEQQDDVAAFRPIERSAAALLDLANFGVNDSEVVDAALLAPFQEDDELRPVLRVLLIDRLNVALLIAQGCEDVEDALAGTAPL